MPAGYIGPPEPKKTPQDDNEFENGLSLTRSPRIKPSNFPICDLLSGPARLLYNPR